MRRAPTLGALVALAWLTGCAFHPPRALPDAEGLAAAHGGDWGVHCIRSPEVDEPSGLVKSRRYAGVFWTHNDSGDGPRIFAVSATGDLLATYDVAGACHVDWEDIATDDAGTLYLADTGNNFNSRRDLVVYAVREPDPGAADGATSVARVLPFRYGDQVAFPGWTRWNFDAEALFWMDGVLHLLTKHRSDGGTRLYRLRVEDGGRQAVLRPVASFDLCGCRPTVRVTSSSPSLCGGFSLIGNVTGADFDPERGILAVLTYRSIYLFRRCPDPGKLFAFAHQIRLDPRRTQQVESIAWDGPDLVVGNEDGYLFRLPDPVGRRFDDYPPASPEVSR
ncbi:MAG: hypothetical protein ACYTG6_00590 [Planctomycetota bacterium]|jgi:hypothetical protein